MQIKDHDIPGLKCDVWIESSIKHHSGRSCGRRADTSLFEKVYFCDKHYDRIDQLVQGRFIDRIMKLENELEDAEARANQNELEYDLRRQERIEKHKDLTRRRQMVYFVQCEGYVKIGVSSSPAGRLL